jgi:Zn-dependent peptidase ImmA (M78 family)
MIKRFRIPKTIRLPGVVVRVFVVPPSELDDDCDACWMYDEGKPVIRISASLGIKRKRYLLYHELQHAIHDILHTALQDNENEVAP